MNTQTVNKGAQFIMKTAQHTFETSTGLFFKVVPFTQNEIEYVATLEFTEPFVDVRIIQASDYNCISTNGKSYVNNERRQQMFPQHTKRTAISTVKTMRILIAIVTDVLIKNDPKEKSTIELVKTAIKNREF